jgi:hypothetical protein
LKHKLAIRDGFFLGEAKKMVRLGVRALRVDPVMGDP